MKRYILWTIVMAAFSGCVKETGWDLPGGLPSTIVVDAILTDEVKAHRVVLSRPAADLNAAGEPVTGAGVVISNDDSTWQLAESPAGSGVYLTPAWFSARTDKTYTLLVSAGDRIFSARSGMEPGAAFNELRYAYDENRGLYYVDWVANAFSTQEAAMWELLIDWSGVAGFESQDSLDTHARLLFYTLPTLDVSEIFAPMMETVFFPAGTLITERRYSLTDRHAEYARELLLETNWTGGLFPVAPANVTSNVSEGGLGFFGVCAVTRLSVVVGP